jgi:hypothetical protein
MVVLDMPPETFESVYAPQIAGAIARQAGVPRADVRLVAVGGADADQAAKAGDQRQDEGPSYGERAERLRQKQWWDEQQKGQGRRRLQQQQQQQGGGWLPRLLPAWARGGGDTTSGRSSSNSGSTGSTWAEQQRQAEAALAQAAVRDRARRQEAQELREQQRRWRQQEEAASSSAFVAADDDDTTPAPATPVVDPAARADQLARDEEWRQQAAKDARMSAWKGQLQGLKARRQEEEEQEQVAVAAAAAAAAAAKDAAAAAAAKKAPSSSSHATFAKPPGASTPKLPPRPPTAEAGIYKGRLVLAAAFTVDLSSARDPAAALRALQTPSYASTCGYELCETLASLGVTLGLACVTLGDPKTASGAQGCAGKRVFLGAGTNAEAAAAAAAAAAAGPGADDPLGLRAAEAQRRNRLIDHWSGLAKRDSGVLAWLIAFCGLCTVGALFACLAGARRWKARAKARGIAQAAGKRLAAMRAGNGNGNGNGGGEAAASVLLLGENAGGKMSDGGGGGVVVRACADGAISAAVLRASGAGGGGVGAHNPLSLAGVAAGLPSVRTSATVRSTAGGVGVTAHLRTNPAAQAAAATTPDDPTCLDPYGGETPPSVAAARLRALAWAAAPRSVGGNDGGSYLFTGPRSCAGGGDGGAADSPALRAAEEGRAGGGGNNLTSAGGRRRSVVSFAPETLGGGGGEGSSDGDK